MQQIFSSAATLLTSFALVSVALTAAVSAGTTIIDFAADKDGQPAMGFACARTGTGRTGIWKIVQDTVGAQARNVLAQVDADTADNRFPVCVRDDVTTADVDLSVKFRPVSGGVDQAAGLVWRYKDVNNYYIVRANALEDNVVLYKVQNGKRIDLPLVGKGRTYGGKAPVPKKQWSTLRVTAVGKTFTVFLNDAQLFTVEDTTFTEPGRVGVWTKADSVTYFTDLSITTQ